MKLFRKIPRKQLKKDPYRCVRNMIIKIMRQIYLVDWVGGNYNSLWIKNVRVLLAPPNLYLTFMHLMTDDVAFLEKLRYSLKRQIELCGEPVISKIIVVVESTRYPETWMIEQGFTKNPDGTYRKEILLYR